MSNLPTVKIKGKDYTLVKDRILHFNEAYPEGCIRTELLSDPQAERIAMRAIVIPDCEKPARAFIGHAQEIIGNGYINESAAMENCETSAVGRALAMMGIGVVSEVASVDEINKSKGIRARKNDINTFEYEGATWSYMSGTNKNGRKYEGYKNVATDEVVWSDKEGFEQLQEAHIEQRKGRKIESDSSINF